MGTILRDRFVSLGASFDGGVIVTQGQTLARSKPVKGDKLDRPVEWEEGNLTNVTSPVSLKITLRNALLFALWCP